MTKKRCLIRLTYLVMLSGGVLGGERTAGAVRVPNPCSHPTAFVPSVEPCRLPPQIASKSFSRASTTPSARLSHTLADRC